MSFIDYSVKSKALDECWSVEMTEESVSELWMSPEDYRILKPSLRLEFNFEPRTPRTGWVGTWAGSKIFVKRGFGQMLAIPELSETVIGCLPALKEKNHES